MGEIYLVRHGKLQMEDEQRRYIGQLDIPLSKEGVQQAEALKNFFSHKQLKSIYSSDLIRSQHTAEIIAGARKRAIKCRQEFREISLGSWEGNLFTDIMRQFPDEFAARGKNLIHYRPPGGESFADCSQRVIDCFNAVISDNDDVLIVAHAGVNRLLLCYILGISLDNMFRLGQDYGCINIIAARQDDFQVKVMNMTLGES